MIGLGKRYRDRITGFKGFCTGYVTYITGCNQALLVPSVDRDGRLVESQWFDEQRLEKLSDYQIELNNGKSPGFDKMAPKI